MVARRLTLACIMAVLSLCSLNSAQAADGQKKKLVCAPGTEMYGAPPPHGANIWCRQPQADGTFIRQGMYASYNRNGKVRVQGTYYNDKPHGVWEKYDRDGHKVATTVYYDGNAVRRFRYDENGKPVGLSRVDDSHKKREEARKKQRELNDWRHGKAYIPKNWAENR